MDATAETLEPAVADKAPPKKDWSNVVVVADGPLPTDGRPSIVVETRDDKGALSKDRKYPSGADIYYRHDASVDLGIDPGAQLVTMGDGVMQGHFSGLATHPNLLNVGPASPVYAAVNLAYQKGAKAVEVTGLTDAQKAHLKPWFDQISGTVAVTTT